MRVRRGLGRIQNGTFDGVKIIHGTSFLSGSRLYSGLWVCCPVYNADFVNRRNLCNCAFPFLLVKGLCPYVKGKGHLRKVGTLYRFIDSAALRGIGKFSPHFKAAVRNGQGKCFRTSGKGNVCSIMVYKQGDVIKVHAVKGGRGNAFCIAPHIGGLVEYNSRTLDNKRSFPCPDAVRPCLRSLLILEKQVFGFHFCYLSFSVGYWTFLTNRCAF